MLARKEKLLTFAPRFKKEAALLTQRVAVGKTKKKLPEGACRKGKSSYLCSRFFFKKSQPKGPGKKSFERCLGIKKSFLPLQPASQREALRDAAGRAAEKER
ncbi:hypothetical protein, partial [Pontibacter korlensis]